MNYRRYHDREVSLASLGGESIFKSPNKEDWEEARQIIDEYLDAGGVLIDTSPIYTYEGHERLSEKRFGEVLPHRKRDEFIICTKTEERHKEAALKDLDKSLKTLKLDYVDEWRIHHVDNENELNQIFSKNGVIHAMDKAIEDGLVKRASISGHSDPDTILKALKRYKFGSVLGSINVADRFLHSFQKKLIPYCKENDIPFIGMKITSRGRLFRYGGIINFKDLFDYVLSIDGITTAIVGISNIEQLHRLIECDEEFKKLSESRMKHLEDSVKHYAREALFFRKGEEWPDDVEIDDLPKIVL